MKKLPPGSEASNVLVGEVDFLSHPIIAFVRLAQGQYLGDITEVPIPTRFIFIMLGPTGNQERYHEIGRSISTLMSDEVRLPCECYVLFHISDNGRISIHMETASYNTRYVGPGRIYRSLQFSCEL